MKQKTALLLSPSLLVFLVLLVGCSSNLTLVAERTINNDVRLPIDIIMVEDAASVLAIGPDSWFGHPQREKLTLDDELIRLSFSGGERMDYKLSLGSKIDKLIIFADFINQEDRKQQQVVIPRSRFGFSKEVRIGKDALEMKE